MMTRPDWDTYFLNIAEAVSARADCTRSKVGAVLVSPDHRIVSTGYNGSPAGEPGCLTAGACSRGEHYDASDDSHYYAFCACGRDWPCPVASAPGSDYSNCVAIHAEANALLYANRADCQGATLYITREPCADCSKLMLGAKLARCVWPGGSIG